MAPAPSTMVSRRADVLLLAAHFQIKKENSIGEYFGGMATNGTVCNVYVLAITGTHRRCVLRSIHTFSIVLPYHFLLLFPSFLPFFL